MALGAALVDRARAVTRERTGASVDGEQLRGLVTAQWFKARLEVPQSPESPGPGSGRRRTVRQPSLLVAFKDLDGRPVELSNAMRLEVDSAQLGRSLWEVSGDPAPLRKRRRVIGWQVTLAQVGRGSE